MLPLGFLHVFRLYSHLSPLFPNYKTISDVMSNRHGTRIAQNLGPRTQLTSNKNTKDHQFCYSDTAGGPFAMLSAGTRAQPVQLPWPSQHGAAEIPRMHALHRMQGVWQVSDGLVTIERR